jgi:Sec-independent protein translocase protein TatA
MSMRLTPLFLSLLVIALLFGLTSLTSLADDLDEGVTAYQQHDYQSARNAWNPGAQQGDADAITEANYTVWVMGLK